MKTIANHLAISHAAAKKAVLIDVREPAEFYEGHLPGAINLPSTQFKLEDYRAFAASPIYLICNSGRRAKDIAAKLPQQEFPRLFLVEQQMDTLNEAELFGEAVAPVPAGWSIDRQFRMTLGLLLLTFLLGYTFVSSWFIIIPLILCAGLIVTSIIDRCYLRMGIAMLPWNRKRAHEIQADDKRSALTQATTA